MPVRLKANHIECSQTASLLHHGINQAHENFMRWAQVFYSVSKAEYSQKFLQTFYNYHEQDLKKVCKYPPNSGHILTM